MGVLTFEGLVKVTEHHNPLRVEVNGVDVLDAINEHLGYRVDHVVAQIDAERFEGVMDADSGLKGYSELTPGEPSMFYVDGNDLLERLEALDGKRVTLTVATPEARP